MIEKKIELEYYKQIFTDWLTSHKDSKARAIIRVQLDRVSMGIGDIKYIDCGIWEMRVDYGPGYRVYFGKYNKNKMVILLGGDKSTQKKDIKKAILYWNDYLGKRGEI